MLFGSTQSLEGGVVLGKIVGFIEFKERIRRSLENILSSEVVERAKRDSHSFRSPRPCGMTIHTGIGCSNMCVYCYIYDMGFPKTVELYPLPVEGLVYALSINPYIVPTKTLAAYGSVTEPFNSVTRDFSLKLIEYVYRYLKLPTQISTKSILDEKIVYSLANADSRCSILVTVTSIDYAKILEPRAPSPIERIIYAGYASKHLHTSIFIRPIIPGVTDSEIDKIFKLLAEYSIKNIVIGSLRVSKNILIKLKQASPSIYNEVLYRLPREPIKKQQIAIYDKDIKEKIARKAREYQLKLYTSACQANIDAHKEFCNMCLKGPCGDIGRWETAEEADIAEFLEYIKVRYSRITVSRDAVYIELKDKISKDKIEYIEKFLKQSLKTIVRVKSR